MDATRLGRLDAGGGEVTGLEGSGGGGDARGGEDAEGAARGHGMCQHGGDASLGVQGWQSGEGGDLVWDWVLGFISCTWSVQTVRGPR